MQLFATLRPAIAARIVAQCPLLQNVYPTDRSQVDGYPYAVVTPSESTADFHEAGNGSKTIDAVFTVRVAYPIDGEGSPGQEAVDLAMDQAVDQLLTAFLDSNALGSVCEWVRPAPSAWGYVQRENGVLRTAEVKLFCRKYAAS